MKRLMLLLIAAMVINVCAADSQSVSYSDLVERLYDVKYLLPAAEVDGRL